MLLFNLSDNSVRIFQMTKMWLAGQLSLVAEKSVKEGLIQNDEIIDQDGLVDELGMILSELKLKDKECAFTLHDERAYTLRLTLPKIKDSLSVSELIREQLYLLIPEQFEALRIASKAIDAGGDQGEIQLVAVQRDLLDNYLAVLGGLGLQPRLVVPESYALFVFLSPVIKEGETVIYLDPEIKTANAVVLDKRGVIEAFAEQDLEKIKRFALEKWGRKIERVFGPENIGDLLPTYPLPIKFKLNQTDVGKFASLFGLALLVRQKGSLNLLD